jgi:steroid delta-isomerase-like uncharacterized protein
MTSDTNKTFMRSFAEIAINQKNLSALDDMVAEDFVEHVPFPGQGPGREGLKFAITAMLTGFPDMHWTIDEQVAEGEMVVSRFTMYGTHLGEFMGIPASGKPIQIWGVVIDCVRDGKLAESRIILDTVTLLQQVGAMPPPGSPS